MAGIKRRGVITNHHKRTVMRQGELVEVKPVRYYGPHANGRMCGAYADTGEMILGADGIPKPLRSI
tara:strand:- start:2268 stop:2465 length:198 start_codon:yes stop_codon:yes gene_type:complete